MTMIKNFRISGDGTVHVDKGIVIVRDHGQEGSISLMDGVLYLGKGAKVVVDDYGESEEDKDTP